MEGGMRMADREKVIKDLHDIAGFIAGRVGIEQAKNFLRTIDDAIELLKEQEAVEPLFIENPYTHLPVSYCPKCREPISKFITGNPYKETKYCHYCGQEVRWE